LKYVIRALTADDGTGPQRRPTATKELTTVYADKGEGLSKSAS